MALWLSDLYSQSDIIFDDENKENQSPSSTPFTQNRFSTGGSPDVNRNDILLVGEPTFFCATCGKNISILQSKTHRGECYYSQDNDACPLCTRKRHFTIMESHIMACAQQKKLSVYKAERTVAAYRCCTENIDRLFKEERNEMVNRYKASLHDERVSFAGRCFYCATYEQHVGGFCLRKLGSAEFEIRAKQAFDSKMLFKIDGYFELLKNQCLEYSLKQFGKRWLKICPEQPFDIDVTQDFMDRKSQSLDRRYSREKEEKLIHAKRLLRNQARILGHKLFLSREHFLVHGEKLLFSFI